MGKKKKTELNIQELWDKHERYNMYNGNTKRRRKKQKNYLEQ